jgi:glycosyltransferase involved in cell wall biosynthesis
VLHLITCLEPGGAEQMLLALCRGLAPTCDLTVVYLKGPGTLVPAFAEIHVPVIGLGFESAARVAALARLALLLKRGRFDVAHTHLLHAGLFGRPLARAAGIPVVIHTQHNTVSWEARSRMIAWANRLSLRAADRVVAVGHMVAEMTRVHANIPPARIETIWNGVDTSRFRPGEGRTYLSRTFGIPVDAPVIGVVAGFREVKGHDVLLPAMVEVARVLPQSRLLLVGDGPLRSRIEALVAAHGLGDRVIFTGQRLDVERIVPECDVIALPSREEGIPVSALEAMACAVPVVATRVGGTPEVIDQGRTGLLVPPGNPGALATALLGLLRNPEYAHRLGKEGREITLGRFSVEAMIAKTRALYERLLAERGGRDA